MHVIASIQARLGSTRLPGKVLLHIGNRRVLQRVVERVTAAKTVDKSVVAIGDNLENEAIITYCERTNTEYIFGSENNLLARHLSVVEKTDCDILVRITADCPFVPTEEIDRVVKEHFRNEAQYTTNVTEQVPTGIAVDVIDPNMLKEFESLGETHPVKRARLSPDEWEISWSQNPSWRDLSDVHMAVDTPEDYWSLIDAVETVGDNPRAVAEWLNK